ncbi:MAG: ribonuclease H-like domain-containing protein [Candidatus Woesebacteria bacterium]|nr:ribonuclease H-like domain-containing protein [Candidatus Woesebacteria bacterium]
MISKIITEVIFDLETQKFFDEIGTFDPAKLGVSVLSLYRRTVDYLNNEIDGEMISFWENDLKKTWDIFNKADRIIGFNSKRFDVPALKPYLPAELAKLPHFDILEHVKEVNGRRVSLNSIAGQTLGKGKIDDPRNAITYWAKHDEKSLAKLKKYCEEDVILTRDIYDFGLKNKKLIFKDYWNTIRSIEVDFSYPKIIEKPKEDQGSLF